MSNRSDQDEEHVSGKERNANSTCTAKDEDLGEDEEAIASFVGATIEKKRRRRGLTLVALILVVLNVHLDRDYLWPQLVTAQTYLKEANTVTGTVTNNSSGNVTRLTTFGHSSTVPPSVSSPASSLMTPLLPASSSSNAQNNTPLPSSQAVVSAPESASIPNLELSKADPDDWYCQWAPGAGKDVECKRKLLPKTCDSSASASTTATSSRMGGHMLILGDSTCGYNFLSKYVRQRLPKWMNQTVVLPRSPDCGGFFLCKPQEAERCINGTIFGFSKDEVLAEWRVHPQVGREGPVTFGANNHGCSDCVSAGHKECSG